jgi:hypothetical protein
MKRAFLKMAFHVTAFVFLFLLAIPSMLVLQVLLPSTPSIGGHYHSNGAAMLCVASAWVISTLIADRCVSFLFKLSGLSGDERWSILKRRSRS